jgi:hypothetical protein
VRRLGALASSLLDGLSVWGREIVRPENEQSPTIIRHESDRARRMADLWETEIDHPVMCGRLNLVQIALACALGLEVRNPQLRWRRSTRDCTPGSIGFPRNRHLQRRHHRIEGGFARAWERSARVRELTLPTQLSQFQLGLGSTGSRRCQPITDRAGTASFDPKADRALAKSGGKGQRRPSPGMRNITPR